LFDVKNDIKKMRKKFLIKQKNVWKKIIEIYFNIKFIKEIKNEGKL